MYNVGLIGWRGMVGSVLLRRMHEEGDVKKINLLLFSVSHAGKSVTVICGQKEKKILNALDLNILKTLDIIICCAGDDYTKNIYFKLRNINWKGYWLDSSSFIRTLEDSLIILDPINKKRIYQSVKNGIKTFASGNCVVNLMLMSLSGLLREDLIRWISVSTYQSISGAGSTAITRFIRQIQEMSEILYANCNHRSNLILSSEKEFLFCIRKYSKYLEHPLFFDAVPWIGKDDVIRDGRTSEEWKIQYETNKILGYNEKNAIPINSTCVRVSSIRCHSQSFIVKLKKNVPIEEIEKILKKNNKWINIITNKKKRTLKQLSQTNVMGTLDINVGRIRKTKIGEKYLSLFSVGDQLLWGSAEPLRRMLKILLDHL
ncbi:aspartate-semialdehyde dehydrogenase [Candidatus Riesia pediculischaeffi]|uniref:Aspartate-semialdehyde dehydrogenase n=1 Tax=Candidatus Riesia pediculischaeffi TaxID=428411 RepID=A0A1V0HKS2_9ENTR|nr:aspartate-semialdehyde dehydrogenase [Candidatus Riesia pediculischaeffi]ARC53416.1 aspartate-semialdehyde dehydrogenase [Candidatus Riesia pediculischaeffi]